MKKILLMALVLTLALLLGCTGIPASPANVPADTSAETDVAASDTLTAPDAAATMTDVASGTDAMPPGGPDGEGFPRSNFVFGRVKSIVGNSVELELGEVDEEQLARTRPSQDRERPSGTPDPNQPAPERSGAPDGESRPSRTPASGEARPGRGSRPNGASPPEGSEPGQRGQGGEGRSGRALNLDITYTGETASYLLPVGMQIGSGDYTAIKAGMVLRLTLDDAGEVVAASIISSS